MLIVIDEELFDKVKDMSKNRSPRAITLEFDRKGTYIADDFEESDERVKEILNAKTYEDYSQNFATSLT